MRRLVAAVGSIVFFLVAPVVVAGVVPWLLTDLEEGSAPGPFQIVGFALATIGVAALVFSFIRFVVEGLGTPAPVAPTEQLVVGGLYRHVRNPMYIAVLTTIVGEALALGRPILLVYALIAGTAMVSFARWYEEPALSRRFGDTYETYKRNVPGWVPRVSPWHGDGRR